MDFSINLILRTPANILILSLPLPLYLYLYLVSLSDMVQALFDLALALGMAGQIISNILKIIFTSIWYGFT